MNAGAETDGTNPWQTMKKLYKHSFDYLFMVTVTTTTNQGFLANFFGKIGEQLQDLSYVEIVTATSTAPLVKINADAPNLLDELEKPGMTILARTIIQLSGDIIMIIPTENGNTKVINKDIMDIHRENTAVAVANWNQFLNLIITAVKDIAELAGLKQADLFNNFIIKEQAPR